MKQEDILHLRDSAEQTRVQFKERVQESGYENILTTCHKELLTKAQKDIINFCSVPRTAQEILDRLGGGSSFC